MSYSLTTIKKTKEITTPKQVMPNNITPENLVEWMVNQPNANGSVYLKSVAQQYVSSLRTTPAKLDLPLKLDKRDVFACRSVAELNVLWDTFKSASNYKQINKDTSGCFSAGMSCLSRYLEFFSGTVQDNRTALAVNIQKQARTSKGCVSPNIVHGPALANNLKRVLSAHFANGFKVDSPIELVRFRRFMLEEGNNELSLSDEELIKFISDCSMLYKGKAYIVSDKTIKQIKKLVDEYFKDGARIIFYAEFYAKNERWLFAESVISEEMLKNILHGLFPTLTFTYTYFGFTHTAVNHVIGSEILRIWGENVILNYEQIAEKLVYIPFERIKQALGQNSEFIWNSVGTFSHISKIDITEAERKIICETVQKECSAHCYISVINLPLAEITERNYELSTIAIENAVFHICLSDKYDKNGKIIVRKGATLNALAIMKEYCQTIEKCSLDDLLNYERKLTSENHRWTPMEAGYAVLVRIDKDTFVSEKYVDFDSNAIDNAIAQFITDEYLPLKSFTTFATFPHCGQVWNHFLLESYCRRFSKQFRFDTPSVNSKNAGTVIRNNCKLNYTEIMANAVARSNIHLDKAIVGKFLYENGYTGRSITSKAAEIIEIAKVMRTKGD